MLFNIFSIYILAKKTKNRQTCPVSQKGKLSKERAGGFHSSF